MQCTSHFYANWPAYFDKKVAESYESQIENRVEIGLKMSRMKCGWDFNKILAEIFKYREKTLTFFGPGEGKSRLPFKFELRLICCWSQFWVSMGVVGKRAPLLFLSTSPDMFPKTSDSNQIKAKFLWQVPLVCILVGAVACCQLMFCSSPAKSHATLSKLTACVVACHAKGIEAPSMYLLSYEPRHRQVLKPNLWLG